MRKQLASESSVVARNRQRGTTLIVTLLFLAIISMLAVSGFTSSTTNLRVTGNMVARQEAMSVAQSVIEDTISGTLFTTDPIAVSATPYGVDIDGDGVNDMQAQLSPAPSCLKIRVIKVTELDPAVATDIACMGSSVASHSGIEDPSVSATTGDSLCASTEWNIRATVDDARTGTSVAVNQGIGVRIAKTDATDFCS